MKVGTPLKIEWKDISTIPQWKDLDEVLVELREEDEKRYYTYGFFVRETKEHISLAATMSFHKDKIDQMSDVTNIVKGCVVNIERL